MKKNVLPMLLFLLFAIGVVITCLATYEITSSKADIAHMNSELYELDDELSLLQIWKDKYSDNEFVGIVLERQIFNKAMIVFILKPKPTDLQGQPLKGLLRLSNLINNGEFLADGDFAIYNNCNKYIGSIGGDLLAEYNRRKDVFKKGAPGTETDGN